MAEQGLVQRPIIGRALRLHHQLLLLPSFVDGLHWAVDHISPLALTGQVLPSPNQKGGKAHVQLRPCRRIPGSWHIRRRLDPSHPFQSDGRNIRSGSSWASLALLGLSLLLEPLVSREVRVKGAGDYGLVLFMGVAMACYLALIPIWAFSWRASCFLASPPGCWTVRSMPSSVSFAPAVRGLDLRFSSSSLLGTPYLYPFAIGSSLGVKQKKGLVLKTWNRVNMIMKGGVFLGSGR